MATTTSKQLQQSQFSTPQEALTPIIGTGHQMVYEAKWALQQIRENANDSFSPEQLAEIVQSLAVAVGWAEALVFEQATDGPTLSSFGNGQQGRQ